MFNSISIDFNIFQYINYIFINYIFINNKISIDRVSTTYLLTTKPLGILVFPVSLGHAHHNAMTPSCSAQQNPTTHITTTHCIDSAHESVYSREANLRSTDGSM